MRSATIDQPRAMEQSFRALWLLYGIVPIVAGADKFVGLLANWEGYIAPAFREMLPVSPTTFMHAVGIIEIVAGILVFALPRVGAWVVTAWLLSIARKGSRYLEPAGHRPPPQSPADRGVRRPVLVAGRWPRSTGRIA